MAVGEAQRPIAERLQPGIAGSIGLECRSVAVMLKAVRLYDQECFSLEEVDLVTIHPARSSPARAGGEGDRA